jgi:hypothetical protein
MHFTDPRNCVPITICYANPYQLAMDDVAAISRLYPVTGQNLSSFPGKQVFSTATARIHGSVWFTDTHGNRTQAMQGVNVVARWIDPGTGLASRRYAAASVSGFLFTGNAGNPITAFEDPIGEPWAEWGSQSQSQEGFFDLAGLQLPYGGSAQYQLTAEAIDLNWSTDVGPYSPGPVTPSGTVQPIVVTVTAGGDVQQDILMGGSEQPLPQAASSWTTPAPMPPAGDWEGTLSGYGNMAYFLIRAQANRTMSVAVTALDESSNASLVKLQPVIGMWNATDPQGTAPGAFTFVPFNQLPYGMTRLDAQIGGTANFLVGISDIRGDGRPDYRYHAYVLYADSVSPARVSVNGGAIAVSGTGFHSGLTAAVGSTTAAPLAASAGQLLVAAPAHGDGLQSITITDALSGSASTMTNVLTYGAAASDIIVLLNAGSPSTPVGTQAMNPMSVRVLAADGVTPISGATVGWSAGNALQLSACGGASSCSTITDQNGNAATWLTPSAIGSSTITATLAPGVYSSSPSVRITLSATESASDLGLITPYLWIAQGATATLPLTARVLKNGIPQNNVTVNFTIVNGSGTLSAASAQTSSSGYATVNLTVTQITSQVQVSACVAPANAPCQPFYANAVSLANQTLQPVGGGGQVSTGQAFQPVIVRVTDFSSPPNPVIAASVTFLTTVLRPGGDSSAGGNGETNPTNPAMPVILKVSQNIAASDMNGLASLVPSSGGFTAPVDVDVAVTAGLNSCLVYPLEVFPAPVTGNSSEETGSQSVRRALVHILGAETEVREKDWTPENRP